MFGDLSPEKTAANPIRNERGSSTRILLLVLLLVVAAAGYLYYFTDLIRPKEAPKPAPVQTAEVKQPIPPRPGQPAGEGAPAKPGEAKPSQSAPAPAPPQGGAPAAPIALPAKPAAAQKPAPVAAPPVKPEPAKVAKVEVPAKPAAAPAPAAKPAPPAAAAKKGAAPAKPASKVEKAAVKRKGGSYALLIGDFVPDATFAATQAKLKKSGITPVRESDIRAAEPMNRLFVAEFNDQDMAEAELGKLKKLTADAFLIADSGRYSLYAGSYFTEGRTAAEIKRLTAKGIKPVARKTQVTIKVTRVTAGSYPSAEEARKDAARLKKLGIVAKVVKTGK
ncbi:MAG: SPOR domain-containing protein [Geobacteraceae bacterium]|nr:SPOR domain-containing protein [Geobacteraceae bacterium]